MPWKIVNLDYACDRPHLHMRDPGAPIHLRTYFDGHVEIAIGAEEPDACPVRATVSRDAVVAKATRFEAQHVRILSSILASLDVEPEERERALGWMSERLRTAGEGPVAGNVDAFPPPQGWPYDLTDDALLDSLKDPGAMPSTRWKALQREARRRGLRVAGGRPELHRRR